MTKWESPWKIYCACCGSDVSILMGKARLKLMNGKRVFYCSKECANLSRKLSIEIKEKALGRYAYSEGTCEICHKKFKYNNTFRGRKFCSRECTYKHQSDLAKNGTLSLMQPSSRKKAFKGNRNALFNGSSIERLMKQALIQNSICFEEEYKLKNERSGSYIFLDFAIPELKIDIECDGEYWHTTKEFIEKDKNRDDFLKSIGWTVLRFPGKKIMKEIERCLEEIVEKIDVLDRNTLSV